MDLVYFALLCSVLVFVHELGHFVVAKVFGVKVLKFSIGFGPDLLRIRGRETEYCVGLLPLGGFVKMLEENRQEPVLPEDRGRTFEAQAIWKRLLIVLAGPAMNVLFPVLLYFGVLVQGAKHLPPTIGVVLPGHPAEGKLQPGDRVLEVDGNRISTFTELANYVSERPGRELRLKVFRGDQFVEVGVVPEDKVQRRPLGVTETIGEIGVRPNRPAAVIGVSRTESPAYRAGLRTFDLVTEIRGKPVKTVEELSQVILDNRGETVPVTYLRRARVKGSAGELLDLGVYEAGVAALTPEPAGLDMTAKTGIESADLYVARVPQGSAEWLAGLRAGDRLLEVDDVELPAWSSFVDRLFAAPERPHRVTFQRGGARLVGTIEQLRREEWVDEYGNVEGRYRVRASNWMPLLPERYVDDAPTARLALRDAVRETVDCVRFILIGIGQILEGKLSLSTLGGPITVYDIVGSEGAKGATYFVWAMAVISINLGLVNLLPIPVLDGGHLLLLAVEALLRRPIPLRVRELVSLVGMVLLVGLMGVAVKNDVERRWDVIEGQLRDLWSRS